MHKLYPSIVIALFIAISAYGASFHTARAFAGGDGTAETPYLIETCENLQDVNDDVTAHYKIVTNIDCTGVGEFTPLGNATSFSGELDGGHYTISPAIGFFGPITRGVVNSL